MLARDVALISDQQAPLRLSRGTFETLFGFSAPGRSYDIILLKETDIFLHTPGIAEHGLFTITPNYEDQRSKPFKFVVEVRHILRQERLFGDSGIWIEINGDSDNVIGIGYDLIDRMSIHFDSVKSVLGFRIPGRDITTPEEEY